jgi:hypothetical protein
MILPNNGKVIVFDDKIDDVKDLLSILSKEQIPYLYYHDEYAGDLPDKPVDNVRLVFLDLELVTNSPNKKNLIGPIAQRLKRTLTPNNIYILIYWSTKEDRYREELEKEFENGLLAYKPLKMLSLNKAKAKDEGTLEYVQKVLNEEIKQFSALNPFMLWESAVNNAAGTITNHVCSIFSKDEKWDINMHGMLYQLAKAQAGTDAIKGLDSYQLLELAVDVFNTNLIESVEKNFQAVEKTIKLGEIKQAGTGMSEEDKNKLNTKIHLMSANKFNHCYPGNLYIFKYNDKAKEIVQRNVKDEFAGKISESNANLICLDITPSCDYSQGKNYSRMVYGILVKKDFLTRKQLKPGEFRYDSCPIMKFDEFSYIMIDFRCIQSYSAIELKKDFSAEPKFRLRNNLLLDIQAQLSNHINRPGIITV